jgi:signal transduction histidine kinase
LLNARGSLNERLAFQKKAITLSNELEQDSLIRESNILFGLNSYKKKDTLGLKTSIKNLIEYYRGTNDSAALAKQYQLISLKNRLQNQIDSAFYYYNKSKDISALKGDSTQVALRYLEMGWMQIAERDYLGSELSFTNGLKYVEPLKEYYYSVRLNNALGYSLNLMDRYREGRKYYLMAQDLNLKNSNTYKREIAELYIGTNIALSYINEKEYRKAIVLLEKKLERDSLELKFPTYYQNILGNYSYANFKLGNYDIALNGYKKVLDSRIKNNNTFNIPVSHDVITELYLETGNKEKALYHARKTLETAEKANNRRRILRGLKYLGELTEGKESKEYYIRHNNLNDSIIFRERMIRDKFARISYETEKKDQLNSTLKAESERQRQQKVISWLVSVAILLTLILSLNFFRNRRKKLMYEAQIQKASAREEERQQIAKSLHDEVAGDLRMLHRKLVQTNYQEEAKSLDKIKENVRNLSHQLSSVSFDEVSFKDQIINLVADNFSLDFRISVEGIDSVLWETVNSAIKRTLYLSARESLQNTLKYAEASKFFMRFSSEKKEILLLLEDNGKGFDLSKGKKGIGLKNLKERVEEIQGSFHIETSDQGTKTTISIPINGR